MAQSTQPVLLTVKEVSQLLRIHRPKVYDLIRDGTIEGFKLGSDWRVKRESIEKLVGEIPDSFFASKKRSSQALQKQAA
jgi:excisionase family DNA binding protein